MNIDILFSILTIPEVKFLKCIGEELIKRKIKVGFILFHSAGEDILKDTTFKVFNIHKIKNKFKFCLEDNIGIEKEYNILNLREIFIREKVSYNRKDEEKLYKTTFIYLKILDYILKECQPKCVIQELGDFVANKCVYYASLKNKVNHIFYEPSPFKGRIFFTLNNYYVDIPQDILNQEFDYEIQKEVKRYQDDYLTKGEMVIPFKDKYSFGDATVSRFVNLEYFRRLKRKIFHKYLVKKEEEYNEIFWVIRYTLLRLFRRKILSLCYSKVNNEKYIYFPLHVPFDIQITTRSNLFYNQIAFVEYLARIIPYGYKLYIKEHPASVGGYSFWGIRNLLREHNNVRLIHPIFSSYHLIKNAELIISINSKVGFEALVQGEKVLVVGDAFYKGKGVTYDVDNLKNLQEKLIQALDSHPPDKNKIFKFLCAAYKWSYPTELFLIEKNNLEQAFNSFYAFLSDNILR